MPKQKKKVDVDPVSYRRIYSRGYYAGKRKAEEESQEKELRVQFLEEALQRASSFLSRV